MATIHMGITGPVHTVIGILQAITVAATHTGPVQIIIRISVIIQVVAAIAPQHM